MHCSRSILIQNRRVSRNALPIVTRDAMCPRACQSEVLSCKLRLCSPISFGFSPCECVLRNPSFPPSSCGELKWAKMPDLRALCRKNLVDSEEEKTCFKTSDKDGNMGSLSRDVLPSQGLLQSAIASLRNRRLKKPLRGRNVST